jgi:DNA polymerase III delta prime subunit
MTNTLHQKEDELRELKTKQNIREKTLLANVESLVGDKQLLEDQLKRTRADAMDKYNQLELSINNLNVTFEEYKQVSSRDHFNNTNSCPEQ